MPTYTARAHPRTGEPPLAIHFSEADISEGIESARQEESRRERHREFVAALEHIEDTDPDGWERIQASARELLRARELLQQRALESGTAAG